MFSTKNVEDSREFVSSYIKPGVGEYKIVATEVITSQGGTPGVKLSFESRPLAELQNQPQKGDFTIYFSEKSMSIALGAIQELGKANGFTKEELDNVSGVDLNQYMANIKPYITKDFIRVKFNGEEILNNNSGKVWQKAVLPAFRFAEATTSAPSKLVFNPEKDIKKLPVADLDAVTDDDLPF